MEIKIETPDTPKAKAVNYLRYTELLSKIIGGDATPHERDQVSTFEAATPDTCPKCRIKMRSFLEPLRIIHDTENCLR